MPAEPLQIQLLGAFEIRLGDRVIPADAWKLRKAAGIVKLLALAPDHRLHREQILDTLWPDLSSEAAANNFRYALHTAREILNAGDVLHREGGYLVLGLPGMVWVDVCAFEAAATAAWKSTDPAAFQIAIDLYAGDLLPADLYEEWLSARRTALRASYLGLLSRLATLREELGQPAAAIEALKRLVAAEPVQEEAHSRLMLLYAQNGQQREALRQYDLLVDILDRELGVEPEPITRELAEAIQAGTFGVATPPPAPERPRTNLPAETTSFIGRERELAEVGQLLGHARLVTLSGPGGVGKTRLALAVARDQLARYAEGVYAVMLAPLSEPYMVARSIAQVLGVQESPGQPLDATLADYLRSRSILLLLDNFEHVLPAALMVSTLLESGPRISILVTSRVALRLRGEHEYPVQPLDLPAPTTDDETTLLASSAARLFVERSQEAQPGFEFNHGRTRAIARICHRLDGLPLAIELAAARSRVLPPEALLERLAHPLDVLTSGPRDLPDRQRTLRSTIAWSYDLLEPAIQALFRTLAVFPGGWTLDAVEAVSPADVDPLDGLSTLIESSLVKQLESDTTRPRYQMLETIREFGLEQLDNTFETETARERHADYYISLTERVAPRLRGTTFAETQRELSMEYHNLRAALTYMLDHDPDRALRVTAGLEKYWFTRGSFTEWGYWLDESLRRSSGSRVEARGSALHQFAFVLVHQGDHVRARATAEESVDIARELGLVRALGRATGILSIVASGTGDAASAMTYAEESLGYYRQLGNTVEIAAQLSNMALLAAQAGDNERSREMLEEAVVLQRTAGDAFFLAMTLGNLGELLRDLGRLREAAIQLDEARELALSIGAVHIVVSTLLTRATIAAAEGEVDLGRELLIQGLSDVRATGLPPLLVTALDSSAILLSAMGDATTATQLFAAAEAALPSLGVSESPAEREYIERYHAHCRSQMDAAAWEHAWTTGSALSVDDAIALATSVLAPH